MASRKTISVEGLAGLAVEIIGVALSHVKGVPSLVWTLLLIFGGCLLLLTIIQWFWRGGSMSDKDEVGGPGPIGDVVANAPVGILFGPGAHSDHSAWNVQFGGEPAPPPTAPPQLPTTPEERDEIREELLRVAPLIGALTTIWYVNPHEAMKRSGGTQEDGYAWRNQHDAEVTQRYIAEIYPSVVAVYQRGRIRGFFDPEIEKIYEETMYVQVKNLPALFTRLADRS